MLRFLKVFIENAAFSSENPWINQTWATKFNCDEKSQDCLGNRLDSEHFQIDPKVDFVFDSVRVYVEAVERCEAEAVGGCPIQDKSFFNDFLLKTKVTCPEDNRSIEFDCNGDIATSVYDVYGLRRIGERFTYRAFGAWSEGSFKFSVSLKKASPEVCRPKCNHEDETEGRPLQYKEYSVHNETS